MQNAVHSPRAKVPSGLKHELCRTHSGSAFFFQFAFYTGFPSQNVLIRLLQSSTEFGETLHLSNPCFAKGQCSTVRRTNASYAHSLYSPCSYRRWRCYLYIHPRHLDKVRLFRHISLFAGVGV